jgi:hypothetical protein
MQLPLDHPECRIHGSIWRSPTLGHAEGRAGEQELKAYGITPSSLYKGDTYFTDVVIWRVQVLQSLSNPPHQMRGQLHVLALNV